MLQHLHMQLLYVPAISACSIQTPPCHNRSKLVSCVHSGGGEYGREWRDAGSLKNKQNVFDDFIACAEWLSSSGYTAPSKLTIQARFTPDDHLDMLEFGLQGHLTGRVTSRLTELLVGYAGRVKWRLACRRMRKPSELHNLSLSAKQPGDSLLMTVS